MLVCIFFLGIEKALIIAIRLGGEAICKGLS
jgi:hypothetical protein